MFKDWLITRREISTLSISVSLSKLSTLQPSIESLFPTLTFIKVLCLNQTNFSWTHSYGRTPEPFLEHSGKQTWKTRERMRTTPRVILILKQASSEARLHKTLAQNLATTWWQEFRKRVSAAMTWWQEWDPQTIPSRSDDLLSPRW